jgi:DNA-binding transcriptional LysR family regulator
VSHALGRLRYALNDDLFVRDPRGLKPTARSLEIGPQVHAALSQLQAAFAPPSFDPATTDRRFTLVAGAYACAILIPPLVARMAERAPKAELVVAHAAADLLEQLDSRRADFVLGAAAAGPERLARETLLTESLTWVVRAEHDLAQGPVTLEALVAAPHVVIGRDRPGFGELGPIEGPLTMRASWEDFGAFEAELVSRGLTRRIGVVVPDTYSALAVVRRSDMAALIPRRLAMLSVQMGLLRLIEPPYRSPPVDMSMIYLRDRLAEPAMAWMRDQLRELAADL